MANPYDVEYTVPEGQRIEYPANSCNYYEAGDVVRMSEAEYATCRKLFPPVDDKPCCFPEYCAGSDGYPTGGHRVPVVVPPGDTVIHPVASIEGCRPPKMVCFAKCGNCFFVGYDAEPLIDPEDPNAMAGGGGDMNPTCRDLVDKHGNCVETLHIHNPGDTELVLSLSYYC